MILNEEEDDEGGEDEGYVGYSVGDGEGEVGNVGAEGVLDGAYRGYAAS